jgi:hypothetical protein
VCVRETLVELDTCVEFLTCPDVTFWTVLFETLTERLLFTCLFALVTDTLLAFICVFLFAFAGATSCTLDTT